METINVTQGSDEWHSIRREHFTASEAAAMMGQSSFMTRDELLAMKKLGIEDEKSEYVRRFILGKGHEAEAATRPTIEAMIGEELYPVTGRNVVDGLPLLASFDGLTMDEQIGYEHKLFNEALFAEVGAGRIPDEYTWQLEHQCVVGDLKEIVFTVSDGAEQVACVEYQSEPKRRRELLAGWKQFAADLDAYLHVERKPEPVAEPIKSLPALHIQLVGEVKTSNLTLYRATALDFISRIKTDLQSDEDFANAEAMVKFCDKAEKELDAAKQMALAQTASIDDLFKTVDFLRDELKSKRLTLDKLVKSRKESIRAEIVTDAANAFAAHIAALNKRLGKPYMPTIKTDFPGAIKGKRTIASLRSAVNDELARAKISANEVADRIQLNLASLRVLAADYAHLFADAATIVLKEADDLESLIKSRIADHDKREAERLEREREKIRAEEQAKAKEEAEKVKREAEEAARVAAAEAQAAALTLPIQSPPTVSDPDPVVNAKKTRLVYETRPERPAPRPATATESPAVAPHAPISASPKQRPTPADLVNLVSAHYGVDLDTAYTWLTDSFDSRAEAVV